MRREERMRREEGSLARRSRLAPRGAARGARGGAMPPKRRARDDGLRPSSSSDDERPTAQVVPTVETAERAHQQARECYAVANKAKASAEMAHIDVQEKLEERGRKRRFLVYAKLKAEYWAKKAEEAKLKAEEAKLKAEEAEKASQAAEAACEAAVQASEQLAGRAQEAHEAAREAAHEAAELRRLLELAPTN